MKESIDDIRQRAEELWQKQWDLEHEKRKEAGLATIRVVPAEDEAPVFSREFQAEFRELRKALRDNGLEAESPFMTLDSADAVSGFIGELVIPFAKIAAPVVGVVVGAWLHSKAGRKVKIKVGDVQVEATTKDALTTPELEKILQRALKARTKIDAKR
jgi:hypothetical protein